MDITKPHTTLVRWQEDENVDAKGRNGHIKSTGLEVFLLEFKEHAKLRVTPVTTRNVVTDSCYIEMPYSSEVLGELATFFAYHQTQALAREMKSKVSEDEGTEATKVRPK